MKPFSLLLAVIATLTSAIPQLQVQVPNDLGLKNPGDPAVEIRPPSDVGNLVNQVTCDRMSLLSNHYRYHKSKKMVQSFLQIC